MARKFLAPSDVKPCYFNMILSYMFLPDEDTWEIRWIPFTVRKIIFFGSTVFGLSTNGDLRSHIRLYVLPSHFFSETAHHIFLKFYMKLGFKKLGKMFQELFWSFSPFWLKTVRNLSFWPKMEVFFFVFCFFLRTAHYIFLFFFCLKHRLCSRKKDVFTLFWKCQK